MIAAPFRRSLRQVLAFVVLGSLLHAATGREAAAGPPGIATTATGPTEKTAVPPLTLRHDPFLRPVLMPPQSRDTIFPSLAATGRPEVSWRPKLVAVMVAGSSSVVNLEGRLVGLGEAIEGYRLIQVREREALFEKGRTRVLLVMDLPAIERQK